jgi:hypothetical protein
MCSLTPADYHFQLETGYPITTLWQYLHTHEFNSEILRTRWQLHLVSQMQDGRLIQLQLIQL